MYFDMVDNNHYKFNVDIPLKGIENQPEFILAIKGFLLTFTKQTEINPITLTIGNSDFQIYMENKKVMDIIHIK